MALAFNVMLCLSVFARSCQLSLSLLLSLSSLLSSPLLPIPSFFITLASPLPRLLSVFLLLFLMLWSMVRWVLFIYGHALSVCVGLSNIHLSCAAIIQSLIPSHMQGMKHEHWSLLRSQSHSRLKVEGACGGGGRGLCRAQHALLRTTKRTNSLYLFFGFLFYLLCFFLLQFSSFL